MRCSRLLVAALAILQLCSSDGAFGADDAYQGKTLNLRSGPLTLEPTQAPPIAQAPPAADAGAEPPSLPSAGANEAVLAPADEPPNAGRDGRVTGTPQAISKTIASGRAILRFERRVTPAEREALARSGIEVDDYLGDTAYTARISQTNIDQLVRASKDVNTIEHVVALDERNAHIKIDASLAGVLATPPTGTSERPVDVVVQVWPEADIDLLRRDLEPLGTIKRVSPRTRKIEMSVRDAETLRAISTLKDVKYIAPAFELKSQNTHLRRSLGIDVAMAAPHLLSGQGVRVGVWDGGHVAANHPSFSGRLSVDLEREDIAPGDRNDNRHATHVAGIIAGSGEYIEPSIAADGGPTTESQIPAFGDERRSTTPARAFAATPAAAAETPNLLETRYPGIAVSAQILSFDFHDAAHELISLLADKPDAIDVMNNSWNVNFNSSTCDQLGAYGLLGEPEFDAVVSGETNGHSIRRIPILISAGNTRNDGVCGLSTASGFPNYGTVVPPATAKNVITVGAIDADTNEMTEFSAWGPTKIGRLKPDVVAPGCRKLSDGGAGVMSMVPATGIGRSCGTSIATPAVTGVVALMVEKMGKLGFDKSNVFPSTYKALLIHGAEDSGSPGS